MKIIKTDKIRSKILNADKIRELAQLIHNEYARNQEEKPEKKDRARLRFILLSDDGTQYEDDTMEFFKETGILFNRKIVSVDLSYSFDYGKKDLSVGLHHSVDKDYSNKLTVSGTDETWVNGIYTKLKEILNTCETQKEFFSKHSGMVNTFFFVWILCTLGIIGHLISGLVLSVLRNVTPETAKIIKIWITLGLPGILFAWVMDWASKLSRNLEKLYPNIELLIGPTYLQREAIRRRKLRSLLWIVFFPTLIAIILELIF